MKVLITGTPGSGKTTIAGALKAAGQHAFDGEAVPGLVRLEVKSTGEPAEWPGGHIDWDYYAWNIQRDALVRLLDSEENIFVAISASNLPEYKMLFDKVIVLKISAEELEHRLRTRTTHEFGQDDADIRRWVRNNAEVTDTHIREGALPIDNAKPPEEVAADIVMACGLVE